MKTYRIHFQRTEYGYIEVEAENEAQAEERYFEAEAEDEIMTKGNQEIVQVETLSADNGTKCPACKEPSDYNPASLHCIPM